MPRPLLLLMLCAALCLARNKSDTVTVINGNTVACEILNLSRGILTAKTDSLGTVSIRWQDVTHIRSDFIFEILLTDGAKYLGPLDLDAAGKLVLPGTAAAPLLSVISLTPIGSRFANHFNGEVDAGYSFQKSNTTSQFNIDGDLVFNGRRRSLETEVSSNLLVSRGITSTQKNMVSLDFNQTLPRGYFALLLGQFSDNKELNLLHRYLGGGGAGRYFVHTNHSIVSVSGGAAYSTESYTSNEHRTNAEAVVETNAQIFRLYSPKLDIGGDFRVWPNLTTWGRVRIDAQARVKVEVYKNLFVSVTFTDNYDSQNPTTAHSINDYGIATSVGYSFNR